MKVVISDDYQDCIRNLKCFSKMAEHDVTIHNDTVDDLDALAERFHEAEAIVLIRERTHITDALLTRLPNLKMVSQTGAGFGSHVDLEACTRHKVAVAAGGTGTHSTCEITWGLIHCAMRSIPQEIKNLAGGGWQTTLGEDLYGKTLGVYSYGNIGSQVAAVGKAFGMNVITYGRAGSAERARADGVPMTASKEALFAEADIISLHIRMTPQTRGIVTAKDLGLMKPSALLVNTSRAGLIEEGALEAALKAGRPGFAAVDVYEKEPVRGAQHPLLGMENAICTPHLGYVTRGTFERYFGIAFDQINAFADGNPINIHNPEVLD